MLLRDWQEWIAGVEAENIPAALVQLAAAQTALAARLQQEHRAARVVEETWLSIEQASERWGRSPRWFYRNAKRLPFVKRISRKVLLVGEKAMERWIAIQKA